jgi:protoporphyrinogen oxidase
LTEKSCTLLLTRNTKRETQNTKHETQNIKHKLRIMTQRRIDIIGAGISGLACAYYAANTLRQSSTPALQNVKIHVWEKDQTPGGLAGTFHTPDFTVEKFYHHFYRQDQAIQDLLKQLGLGNDLIWRPAATGAY